MPTSSASAATAVPAAETITADRAVRNQPSIGGRTPLVRRSWARETASPAAAPSTIVPPMPAAPFHFSNRGHVNSPSPSLARANSPITSTVNDTVANTRRQAGDPAEHADGRPAHHDQHHHDGDQEEREEAERLVEQHAVAGHVVDDVAQEREDADRRRRDGREPGRVVPQRVVGVRRVLVGLPGLQRQRAAGQPHGDAHAEVRPQRARRR